MPTPLRPGVSGREESAGQGPGGSCWTPSQRPRGRDTHYPVFEGDQLLLLLLAVLEMRLDQRLQLVEVLLHTLPVNVLAVGGGGGGTQRRPHPQGSSEALGLWDRLGLSPGCCRTGRPSPRVLPQAWRGWGRGPEVFSEVGAALLELSLTSKSTLSPSGILGGTKLGMKGLVGRRRGEHQALPAQRGCGTRMGRSPSSLQKGRDPATHALIPARCPPRAPTPTRDWGAYSGLMYPHSYLEWKPLISFRKTEAQRHKALLKSMQPGSREAWLCTLADPHSWPRPQGPGRRQSASHASPTRRGTPGQDAEPHFPVCPRVWGSDTAVFAPMRGLDCGWAASGVSPGLRAEAPDGRVGISKAPHPSAPRAPTCVLCGPELPCVALCDPLKPRA